MTTAGGLSWATAGAVPRPRTIRSVVTLVCILPIVGSVQSDCCAESADAAAATAGGLISAAMAKKKAVRRKKVAAGSVGLTAAEVRTADSRELDILGSQVEADGGAVLGRYGEPFGGKPVLIVALPVPAVEPTPYQRDPSDAHVKRLMGVVEKIGLFLDPIIAIRHEDKYWTPNGNHRLQALRKLGVKTIVALLVPDPQEAFKTLALNTEKAHNLKEKSLETTRMARALDAARASSGESERSFAFEFEMPSFLTLGAAYEERPRLSGSAYQPILRRVDDFLDEPIGKALKERERRAKK